jgi:uncharacterized RDD family membrane protein YckC
MFPKSTDTPEYPPANILLRTVAFVLDIFLLVFLTMAICGVINKEGMEAFQLHSQEISMKAAEKGGLHDLETEIVKLADENPKLSEFMLLMSTTSFILMILYFTLCEAFLGGSTLGKKVFNLRTAYRDSPRIPPLGQLFIRATIKTFAFLCFGHKYLFILFGTFLIAFFRRDRRTLHDLLTRTSVVPGYLPEQEDELTD